MNFVSWVGFDLMIQEKCKVGRPKTHSKVKDVLLCLLLFFAPFPKRKSIVRLNVSAATDEYAVGKLANVNGHADNY